MQYALGNLVMIWYDSGRVHTVHNKKIAFVVLRSTVANSGECHHKQRKDGHLAACVTARPFFDGVTNSKKSIEYCCQININRKGKV